MSSNAGSITVAESITKSEFKRLILVGIQISNIFSELTDEDDETIDMWQRAVEEKYVKSFTFYAMKSNKAYAELKVTIDWEEHERQINRGNIIIRTKAPDGVLAPTKNVVKRFREYVENNGFIIDWQLAYADHIDIEAARKKFGTSPGRKIVRAEDSDGYRSMDYTVEELEELTYTFTI